MQDFNEFVGSLSPPCVNCNIGHHLTLLHSSLHPPSSPSYLECELARKEVEQQPLPPPPLLCGWAPGGFWAMARTGIVYI